MDLMILAFTLGLCLQGKPGVTPKPMWAEGPTYSMLGMTVRLSGTGAWLTDYTYRYPAIEVGPDPTGKGLPMHVCEFDIRTGTLKVISSEMDTHKDENLPANWEKYHQVGRYFVTQNKFSVATFVDAETFDPVFQMICHGSAYAPVDQPTLAKRRLFPAFLHLNEIGKSWVLWDGPTARIISTRSKVVSYKPGTWEVEGTLIERLDVNKTHEFAGSPWIIGNPEKGPFVISNGFDADKSIYFDNEWNTLNIDPKIDCSDAGALGFLCWGLQKVPSEGEALQCLDPKTGKRRWIRNDISFPAGGARWVGEYALAFMFGDDKRRAFQDRKYVLLDPETGETLYETKLPEDIVTEITVRGDIVIFRDHKFRYYAFRIA